MARITQRRRAQSLAAKRLPVVLFLLSLAYFPAEANACTCRREALESVYQNSSQVFVAEVVRVRKSKLKPRLEETAVYEAVLKPKRMIKGRRFRVMKIKYEVPVAPRSVDGEEMLIVGGCYMEYSVGREFVVLTNPGNSLDWQDWCSSRIHPLARIRMDFLESLGK